MLRQLPRLVRGYATSRPPLKLAVIGSGPSGFYVASRILQLLPASTPEGAAVKVDMYERLPTPYGLARYGVAPDHPEVKNCQHKFDELASDPRFTFLGNVSVGTTHSTPVPSNPFLPHYNYPHALHIPLAELLPYYNAVVFTYGASLSNPLGIPGSSGSEKPLKGVVPALALVSWYNGHPAFADLKVDLSGETVDVVGQGNVALDVARILLRDVDSLKNSDIPSSIVDALSESKVRHVRAVGRRGPGQVAFTTKELREMVTLPGVAYAGVDDALMASAKEKAKGDRMRTRMLGLMEKKVDAGEKRFTLDFLQSPKAFTGKDGKVDAVEWEENELEWDEEGTSASAKHTGRTSKRDTDLVVESVGYRSEPIGDSSWSVPFDKRRGRVSNEYGRVVGPSGALPRVYAAGWAARGPVGVIASTMQDAYGLVETVLGDIGDETSTEDGPLPVTPEPGLPDKVVQGLKEGKVIDMKAWLKIDAAERELGKKSGRAEREKFARVEDMLAVV